MRACVFSELVIYYLFNTLVATTRGMTKVKWKPPAKGRLRAVNTDLHSRDCDKPNFFLESMD